MTTNLINRRTFLQWTCSATALGLAGRLPAQEPVPAYLAGYDSLYQRDPQQAALLWFKEAKYGLFVHYALASLLKRGKPEYLELTKGLSDAVELNKLPSGHGGLETDQTGELIPVNDIHQRLIERFTAERFDANAICDLAIAAGMRYVNLTTRHLGRLALWNTATTDFNSVNAPARRDLVAELSAACEARGLGLFLYVPPETARTDGAFFEHNRVILKELLTGYGPLAGIWFDGIGDFNKSPDNYTRLTELFAWVRQMQPQCLVSFKEGAIGLEDFTSPEHFNMAIPETWDTPQRQQRWDARMERWGRLYTERWDTHFKNKPVEINTTMQECWGRDGVGEKGGWINDETARHLDASEVWYLLEKAGRTGSNLLMNIGPRADGSVHPDDTQALLEVGRRIRAQGFPGKEKSGYPLHSASK